MKIFQPTLSGSVNASGSHTINGALTATTVTASTGFTGGSFTGTSIVGTTVSGTTAQFTSVTASLNGNGANVTSITASNITNFQSDVRGQLSAGTNLAYSAGAFSLSQNPSVTTITASAAFFSGDIIVNGTASIAKLNTINQSSLVVGDKYIILQSGSSDHTSLDGSGIQWGSGSTGPTIDNLGSDAHIRYASSNDTLVVFPSLSGSITGSFNGNGANLTSIPNSGLINSSVTILGQTVSLGGTATVNAGGILSGTLPSPTHLSSSRYATDGVSTSYIVPIAYGGSTYTTLMAESGSSSSSATGSYLRVKAGDGAALTVSANNPSTPDGGFLQIRAGIGGTLSSSATYLTASSGQGGDIAIYGSDGGQLQGNLLTNYYTLNAAAEKVSGSVGAFGGGTKIFKISDSNFVAMFLSSSTVGVAQYYTGSGDTYVLSSSTTFAIANTSNLARDFFALVRTSGTTYRFAYPSTSDGTSVSIRQIELTNGTWGSPGTAVPIIGTASTFMGIKELTTSTRFAVLYLNGSNVVANIRNSTGVSSATSLTTTTIATSADLYSEVKSEIIPTSTNTNLYVFGKAGGASLTFTGSINCKPVYVVDSTGVTTTGSLSTLYGEFPAITDDFEVARVSSGSINQLIMSAHGSGSNYVRFIPLTVISASTANQSITTGTNYVTADLGEFKCAASFDDEKHAFFAHGASSTSGILSSSYILNISGSGATATINVVDSDNTYQTSVTQSYPDALVISTANKKIITFGRKTSTLVNTVQQLYTFNQIYAQKAGDINIIGGSAQKSLNPTELLSYSTGSSISLVTGDGYLGGSINLTATSGTTSGNINLLTSGSVNINSLGNTNISTTGGGTTPANIVLSTGIGTSQDGDIIIAAATGSTNGAGSSSGRGNLTLSGSGDATLASANSVTIDSRLNNGTGSYTYIGQASTPYMFVGFNSIPYYSSVSVTITAAGSTIQAAAPVIYVSPDAVSRTIATIEGRDSGSSAIDGQMLIIINPSATSFTLVETGNIKTSGTSAAVNVSGGSVTLLYSSALGKWLQIGQPAVPVAV